MPALIFSLFLGTAFAQDMVPEVDLSNLPDLLEGFHSKGPVMGECPLGSQDAPNNIAPADHLLHLGTTGFYLDYEKRLDLDAAQVKALQVIRNDTLRRGAVLDAQLEVKENALWTLTGGTSFDQAVVAATVNEIEALQVERRLLYIVAISQAAGVLRPEQVAKLIGS